MLTKNKMNKGKILLVEDSHIIQILVDNLLTDIGYDVTIVSDGLQAIKVINAESPDLLILDLMMPVMDGFALLEKLKGKIKFPIIIVTARSDFESIEKCIHLGATDYLIKPFNSTDLINKVERILAK